MSEFNHIAPMRAARERFSLPMGLEPTFLSRLCESAMSAEIDIKACTILERFGAELLDAQVDYCCTQDLHEFLITREGVTHEVGFTELVLQLKELPDIEQVVARLAEEIKASSQPRKIRVGSRVDPSQLN